ncbi:hypothetical protein [Nakamurella aerolata]|uniref:Uncharacterized protein n=1 Tax=Nakamurella aerolata TaxID=1656892 RepID=A0A849A7H0_9ACTN|nr:hypothetical protein [Nakamurella aerolata]NNG36924.1 hypothetical protein [Nakamurella aerolata]
MTHDTDLLPPPDPVVPCCDTAAYSYGEQCTCWVAEYDQPQQPIMPGPPPVRRSMCRDCAYRTDSPERADIGGDPLDFTRATPFYCHQGVRSVARWRHPSGAVIEAPAGAYDPPQTPGVIYAADGRPEPLCAGWAASNGLPRTYEPAGGAS